MKSKIFNKNLLPILISFISSYTIYVYVLQPGPFFSRSRLAFALLVWGSTYLMCYFGKKYLTLPPHLSKLSLSGIGSLLVLVNLILAGRIFQIPYTYLLLPSHTVKLQPISQEKLIQMTSYSTDQVAWVSLDHFEIHQGWRTAKNGITLEGKQNNELVWQGKPGQFVEIKFFTCPTCGKLTVQWNPSEVEEIDLASDAETGSLTIRHEYPSLILHRLVNFMALEITSLIVAILVYFLGSYLFGKVQDVSEGKAHVPLYTHLPFLGLAMQTIVVYGLKLKPILFNDDWCFVFELYFNIIEPSMQRRPLLLILLRLFKELLPIHHMIVAVYLTQVGILFATSALVFILFNRMVAHKTWFAFLVASLFLVFPTDFTRLYFTMSGIRLSFLLSLLSLIWLVDFIKSGKMYWLVGVILMMTTSLLTYEGNLGLLVAFPFLPGWLYRKNLDRKKIIGLAGYYGFFGLFLIWKLVIQPQTFTDPKITSLSLLEPGEILTRFLSAPKMLLGGYQFPYRESGWLTESNLWLAGLLFVCVLAFGLLALRLSKHEAPEGQIETTIKTNGYIFLAGLGLWLAGYVPIILNYPPNLYGHLSRVNLFSIPGAVLILLSLFHTAFLSLSGRPSLATRLTIGISLPLIFAGSIIQVQTQEAYNTSWTETQMFYQTLLTQIPDIKHGTQIVLILNGYQGHEALFRPLFSSSWEPWCAFGLLYDKTDLNVNYHYEQLTVPSYPTATALTSTLEREYMPPIQDPAKLLVLEYDRLTHHLTIQEDASFLLDSVALEQYSPYVQIIPMDKTIPARKVIE